MSQKNHNHGGFTLIEVLVVMAIIAILTAVLVPSASKKLSALYKRYKVVSVFYATDRNATGKEEPHAFFGGSRGTLSFGVCDASIPEDHRIGALETPFILYRVLGLKRFAEDPEQHVVLLAVEPKAQAVFLAELKNKIAASEKRGALVFIHGYNVSFEDSCRRTAQLAYDLKFSGAPMMYSWPSEGSLLNYVKDETDVEWSTPDFERFLEMLADETGARTIHLVAHSMGNRALVNALASIVKKRGKDLRPLFSQVVLTAPDLDAGVFRNLARIIQKGSLRTTLYASSNDEALNLSKKFHGYARLGDAGHNLTVVKGMDTVDASSVKTSFLGHSYFGDEDSVIADLHELVAELKPPDQRFYLRERKRQSLAYWEFRKRKGD